MTLRGKPSAAFPTYAPPTRSGVRLKETLAKRRVEKDDEGQWKAEREREREKAHECTCEYTRERERERERSSLVDDPASKEPLHVGESASGGESGNLPRVLFSLSVLHPRCPPSPLHHSISLSLSLSRAVRFSPPAEDVPAQAPIQPIVGPRLITTLPNVRPSYRGRVRHGGPRALTNSRDIPASKQASERANERLNKVTGLVIHAPTSTCIHSPPRIIRSYIRRDSQ